MNSKLLKGLIVQLFSFSKRLERNYIHTDDTLVSDSDNDNLIVDDQAEDGVTENYITEKESPDPQMEISSDQNPILASLNGVQLTKNHGMKFHYDLLSSKGLSSKIEYLFKTNENFESSKIRLDPLWLYFIIFG